MPALQTHSILEEQGKFVLFANIFRNMMLRLFPVVTQKLLISSAKAYLNQWYIIIELSKRAVFLGF